MGSSRSVAGKVVVVTGAASGMGRTIAEVFGAEGAQVAATDRNADDLPAPPTGASTSPARTRSPTSWTTSAGRWGRSMSS